MPSLKKSKKSQIQNQKTNKLANLTISVFFLNILIISTVLMLIFFIFGQNHDDKPSGWRALIEENLNHYRKCNRQMFISQFTRGLWPGTHRQRLNPNIKRPIENELAIITPDSSLPLFENITPSGKYRRLNLKRCKAAQIPTAKIVTAVLNSVSKSPDDSSRFIRRWEIVEKIGC